MKAIKWLLAALAALLILFWGWRTFFPNDERIIRRMLADLAAACSVKGEEKPLPRLGRVNRITGFFGPQVVIKVEIPQLYSGTVQGREELTQAALAAYSLYRQVEIKLLDVQVELSPDRRSASAHMTGKALAPGREELAFQELEMKLEKLEGQWRISKVETVQAIQ